jgi:O-antigen/teichoic acid export membrane protein
LYRDADVGSSRDKFLAWRRYADATIPSLLMVATLVIVISPELTNFLMGKSFQAASEYVLWGALAELARVLTGVFSMAAHLQMRTSRLVFPSLTGALLAVGLSLFLVPLFGATGAGISLVCSGFITVLLMYYFILSDPLSKIDWLNGLKKLFIVLTFFLLAGLVRLVIQPFNLLDSILVVFIIVIGFLALQYILLRDHLLPRDV